MKRFCWNWIHYTISEFTKSIKSTVWQPAVGEGGSEGGGALKWTSRVMWKNYLARDDLLTRNRLAKSFFFECGITRRLWERMHLLIRQWMLCSWDRTVCWGGGVTRIDRCKLSMAANFIILQTAQNATACTDSVSLPSQHRLTVSDFLLAAFICRDIFTFLPLSLIFITADRDVVSALKDQAKVHPREGRKDVIFE